jgi:hypothetical protein
LWRTQCDNPRLDGIIYDVLDKKLYLKQNIINYLGDKYTDPRIDVKEEDLTEMYKYVHLYTNAISEFVLYLVTTKII